MQDERFEKIQRHNNLVENKVEQIEEDASRNQVKEVNVVLTVVQKEEKQTTHTPYKHPNYNRYFDQRQGQHEHSQKSYVDRQAT